MEKMVTAFADVTETYLQSGELGIFEELRDQFEVEEGASVSVALTKIPDSVGYIRKKMEGQPLAKDEIYSIIRDVVARTRALYPYMPLNVEIAEDLPVLHIDATRVAQVLNNLLSNANKYAPGSEVNIRVTRRKGQVHIEVSDRGPGIPAEHIPNLFERFYRVPESVDDARGTGLGLFICRKLVEAHGGEIGVDSVPGEGARFFFTLPVPPSSAESEMESQDERREDHPSS